MALRHISIRKRNKIYARVKNHPHSEKNDKGASVNGSTRKKISTHVLENVGPQKLYKNKEGLDPL